MAGGEDPGLDHSGEDDGWCDAPTSADSILWSKTIPPKVVVFHPSHNHMRQ